MLETIKDVNMDVDVEFGFSGIDGGLPIDKLIYGLNNRAYKTLNIYKNGISVEDLQSLQSALDSNLMKPPRAEGEFLIGYLEAGYSFQDGVDRKVRSDTAFNNALIALAKSMVNSLHRDPEQDMFTLGNYKLTFVGIDIEELAEKVTCTKSNGIVLSSNIANVDAVKCVVDPVVTTKTTTGTTIGTMAPTRAPLPGNGTLRGSNVASSSDSGVPVAPIAGGAGRAAAVFLLGLLEGITWLRGGRGPLTKLLLGPKPRPVGLGSGESVPGVEGKRSEEQNIVPEQVGIGRHDNETDLSSVVPEKPLYGQEDFRDRVEGIVPGSVASQAKEGVLLDSVSDVCSLPEETSGSSVFQRNVLPPASYVDAEDEVMQQDDIPKPGEVIGVENIRGFTPRQGHWTCAAMSQCCPESMMVGRR